MKPVGKIPATTMPSTIGSVLDAEHDWQLSLPVEPFPTRPTTKWCWSLPE